MRPTVRVCLMCLVFVLSALVLCTINDDNGNPAISRPDDTGSPDGGDDPQPVDTQQVVVGDTIPRIAVDDFGAISVGDTLTLNIHVWRDTLNPTPINSESVIITAQRGWVSANTLLTDAGGHATVLYSDTTEGERSITVTAGETRSVLSVFMSSDPVLYQKRNMTIDARPYIVQADGISTSTITVKVKNSANNPIVGDSILFSTERYGSITASAITNANGTATATLTSERRNVTAHVLAILGSDTTERQSIEIDFIGVSVAADVTPKSIVPDGSDSCIITVTLLDAADDPIYGEKVVLDDLGNAVTLTALNDTTDTRGEARFKLVGTGSGSDTIMVSAAGDFTHAVVCYSSNQLTVEAAPKDNPTQPFLARSDDTTTVTITYQEADGTPIGSAPLSVSVTSGLIGTIFATELTTHSSSGKATFDLCNPDFATTVTITVTATKGGVTTNKSHQVYFRADEVARIELNGTPEVVGTGGDRAIITATAFDINDNRVKDAVISFHLSSGPGAGENLDPPTATTNIGGMATTNLVSGDMPSKQQDVKVYASSFSGVLSNVVKFTIAGPAAYVSIGKDLGDIVENADGTYSYRIAAIVTDINRNPVVDGTKVTFSLQVTAFVAYKKVATFDRNEVTVTVSDEKMTLPFEDFNDNYQRDAREGVPGEPYPLYRGEDVVWSAGDNTYNPGPAFIDINCNGRRDYDTTFADYEPPEPSIILPDQTVFWADYYANDVLDVSEPLVSTMGREEYEDTVAGFIPGHGYPDMDWNNNGIPDPGLSAASLAREKTTVKGIAANTIDYLQSHGLRLRVRIWAESEGVSSLAKEEFMLPISLDDAPYFRPYEGKIYK